MSFFKWVSSLFLTSQEQEEVVRARDSKGRFVGDDPSTEKNEAYVKKKKGKKK